MLHQFRFQGPTASTPVSEIAASCRQQFRRRRFFFFAALLSRTRQSFAPPNRFLPPKGDTTTLYITFSRFHLQLTNPDAASAGAFTAASKQAVMVFRGPDSPHEYRHNIYAQNFRLTGDTDKEGLRGPNPRLWMIDIFFRTQQHLEIDMD